MPFDEAAAPSTVNAVNGDKVWRQHVAKELDTQRKWEETWGYLRSREDGAPPVSPTVVVAPCRTPRSGGKSQQDWEGVTAQYTQRMKKRMTPRDRQDRPLTTQQEFGWRTNNLELFGVNHHGRTLDPDLWAEISPHQMKF